MSATSKTIVRMWNKDGYHKDVAVLDSDQIRMSEERVQEPASFNMQMIGGIGSSVVIDASKFPEATCFQVIVIEYPRGNHAAT